MKKLTLACVSTVLAAMLGVMPATQSSRRPISTTTGNRLNRELPWAV